MESFGSRSTAASSTGSTTSSCAQARLRCASSCNQASTRPANFSALFDRAIEAYAARAPFYLSLALAIFAIQGVVTFALQALPNKDVAALIEQGVNVGVDAFLSGAVTIGIAARLTDEELSRTSLLRIVARRWWTIFAVDLVAWLIHAYTFSSIFGGPDDTGYGLFSLATVIIWGSLLYADVIASLDGQTPPAAVPGFSLLRSIGIALRLPNLLRTVLLSAMTLPATMLPMLLGEMRSRSARGPALRLLGQHPARRAPDRPLPGALHGLLPRRARSRRAPRLTQR